MWPFGPVWRSYGVNWLAVQYYTAQGAPSPYNPDEPIGAVLFVLSGVWLLPFWASKSKPSAFLIVIQSILLIVGAIHVLTYGHITFQSLPAAYGNESAIRQLYTNLISNAIKYASKTPHLK